MNITKHKAIVSKLMGLVAAKQKVTLCKQYGLGRGKRKHYVTAGDKVIATRKLMVPVANGLISGVVLQDAVKNWVFSVGARTAHVGRVKSVVKAKGSTLVVV